NLPLRECYNETECKKLESVSVVELMLTTTQFAPILRQLSHSDKLLLLNFLVAELLRESGIVPMSIQDDVHRQGLHDSFEAAAILAQALKETQELTHG
ncbi:hypothetical protein, partial [Dolichospermum sp. UHCC 0299]